MVERFDEIIIRARIKPRDPLLDRPASGQDDDGHGISGCTDTADKIKPIAIRQAEIEKNEIKIIRTNGLLGIRNAGQTVDTPACLMHPLA
jgi:hypothetical protein